MTESQFAFTSADEAAPYEDEDGGSKRNLIALGGLAAVVLAGGAFFLLSGGDAAEEEVAFTPRAPRVAETVAPAVVAPVKLPVATTVPLGRNPFRALYVAPAAGGGGGVSTPVAPVAPVTPVTTTPTTGSPIVVITPTSPSSAPAPTSTTAPEPPQRSFSTVTLSGVDGKTGVATFVYDGDELTGKVGEVMGGKLKLISLQQDQTGRYFANLQLGDGSPFEVFEDQTVVVQ